MDISLRCGVLVKDRLQQLIDQRLGGNQSELARRLGEKPYWVNYRITGVTRIKADELPKIAEALGVHPCDFFEDPQQPEEERPISLREAAFRLDRTNLVYRQIMRETMGLDEEEAEELARLINLLHRRRQQGNDQ